MNLSSAFLKNWRADLLQRKGPWMPLDPESYPEQQAKYEAHQNHIRKMLTGLDDDTLEAELAEKRSREKLS